MFCECYARARERGRAEKCRALDSGGAAIVCAIQYSEQKTLNRMPGRPSDLSSFKYLYIFRVAYSFRSVHFSPSSFFSIDAYVVVVSAAFHLPIDMDTWMHFHIWK